MKAFILSVFHERLHRYVFDRYYVQNYKIKGFDWVVLKFYHWVCKANHNWRHTIHARFKKYRRYSDYDRNQQTKDNVS